MPLKTAYKIKAVVLTIEEEDEALAVTEAQKQFVYNSIKKYQESPQLLINEEDAWKMINAD